MAEAEGKIAGLEAGAGAAMQHLNIDALRRHRHHGGGQRIMGFAVAVIQHLNGETILGPVHPASGVGDPQRQRAFIADRKLHQNMRQFALRQRRQHQGGSVCGSAHRGQHRQLHESTRNRDQDAGEAELQKQGQCGWQVEHAKVLVPKASLCRPRHDGPARPGRAVLHCTLLTMFCPAIISKGA